VVAALVSTVAIAGPARATPAARDTASASAVAAAGTLSGVIASRGSGEPIAGVWLTLLGSGDAKLSAHAVADGAGAFTMDVRAGDYFLYLVDPNGEHETGFWGAPALVSVVPGEVTTIDPFMDRSTGSITGVVTDDVSGSPLAGAWAIALSAGGAPEAAAVTNSSGRFTMPDLRAGAHRITYLDPSAAHVS